MKRSTACFVLILMALVAGPALAQHDGGSTGCGDLFGDLIHIKRDATTGVPILAKRWVEIPEAEYGWAYCPVAVREDGSEIGFLPLSCDPAEVSIPVDYFGRLSAGRTKERNLRMHFNEVVENVKMAQVVDLDEVGRLKLTFPDGTTKVIDSPVENISLYHRVMKYGHVGTSPLEVDKWAHPPVLPEGVPNLQYHPALDAADYGKFTYRVESLLPGSAADCFAAEGPFIEACARPAALDQSDMLTAASFLAAGADKTGKVTVDLLQYMNRILKVTTTTDGSMAAVATLPALVRTCFWDEVGWTPPGEGETPADPAYGACEEVPAGDDLPFPADEKFVKFESTTYDRASVWTGQTLDALRSAGASFVVTGDVPLYEYLQFKNAGLGSGSNIDGFVKAANDTLRAVEFVHNYEIPDDLGWDFKVVKLK